MAVSTTYSTLLTDVQSYVDDDVTEFVAALPGIVNRAMTRIQRDLELSIWRTREHTSVPNGEQFWNRPTGMLKVYSIIVQSTMCPIEKRSNDYVQLLGHTSGVPRAYAENDETTLMLGPIPNANYAVYISYLKRLPALSTANETNWITDNAGDMLLYATLVGSEQYLIGQERSAEFNAEYDRCRDAIRNEMRGLHNEEYAPLRNAAPTAGLT